MGADKALRKDKPHISTTRRVVRRLKTSYDAELVILRRDDLWLDLSASQTVATLMRVLR